ncbi:MAG: hypothetical protein JXB50_12915 [Spirochaetes bacterium]|nr:hypothetical protein [Spirochaetota bacterium]
MSDNSNNATNDILNEENVDNKLQQSQVLREGNNFENVAPITLLDKIVEFFTGFSSEERIKLKKLKEINKQVRSYRNKFYNYKKEQILPQLPRKFYELYRLTQHLNRHFDINVHKKSIKLILFDIFSESSQNNLKDELEFEPIKRLIKNTPNTKEAIEIIKNKLAEYIKSFSSESIRKIDYAYNCIADFSNITNYDWLFLLKKFDSEISDLNFSYNPDFEIIEGKYILEDIITLNDYLVTIDFNKDLRYVYDYLKSSAQDDNIVNIMKKAIQICKELKKDDHLTKIIQLIYKDPYFTPKQFQSNAKIVHDYIQNFQREVKSAVDSTLKEIKREKIESLLLNIFHKTVIIRLKYYTGRLNDLLVKKGLFGFQYIDPMNYLKAFILDYCKGEIKSRIDALLILGTWSTNTASSSYSQLLEQFNRISDTILEFDNSCSEDESYGRSLKKLSMSMKHDNVALNTLKKVVIKIDSEALEILLDSIKVLSHMANKIKELLDDYKSKNPKIIINFTKIKWNFPEDPSEAFSALYTKIANFVALLKYFTKTVEPPKTEVK